MEATVDFGQNAVFEWSFGDETYDLSDSPCASENIEDRICLSSFQV